ncbi:hypothetical protein F4803DRAFT_520949 [Xylaria telfairii]|nr:hypothetical protein F4803DRAFT_520949 [Xylaria telfairii]
MNERGMAQETVGHVVAALADSFTAGLECYASWRQRQRRRNHYFTRGATDTVQDGICASLAISKLRIEEALKKGADVLGGEFISGDAACRDVLLENLQRLQQCIEALERAVDVEDHPLPLSELISVSEAVRGSSLAALHKQYQRIAVGRLTPRALPPSAPALLSPPVEDGKGIHRREIGLATATARAADRRSTSPDTRSCNNNSHANHEPPSPPLTPTLVRRDHTDEGEDDDDASTCSRSAASFESRPRNSVFSVFCPEAVKYQVDVRKALPAKGERCRCGYDWDTACPTEDRVGVVVKDGFQITSRFLGKSHCENGLGCVLCTSTGATETFGTVDDLKAHINSAHTKWQLLHDRDLTGRWKKPS